MKKISLYKSAKKYDEIKLAEAVIYDESDISNNISLLIAHFKARLSILNFRDAEPDCLFMEEVELAN